MFFFLSKFVPSMTFNMYWLHHSINLLKIVPFLGGWLSDRLLGDPEGWPHPIVWFGKAISAGEKELNKGSERVLKGGILAVVLILGVYLICEWILSWAWIIHPQFWVADGCRRILLPIRKDAYQGSEGGVRGRGP